MSTPENILLYHFICWIINLSGSPSRKRVEPLTREGASTAASPSEPSYPPVLPCDRDPQLLHGRPHPSLSKHGTRPKPCSVVAAYYLGTLPRPPQRDTVCTIVVAFDTNPSSAVLCVCLRARWTCVSLINQLVLTVPFFQFLLMWTSELK